MRPPKEAAYKKDKTAHLKERLKTLRLPAIRDCFQLEADHARSEGLSYEVFLFEVVNREVEERDKRRTDRLMACSDLPKGKTMELFDMRRLPARVAHQVQVLLTGDFLENHENVLVFGSPGGGKSHLMCAIAMELVHQGVKVKFSTCNTLLQDLQKAKRDLSLRSLYKKMLSNDLLIIDEIGYVQADREEMEVFFGLLGEFYEKRSIMMTSNLPFSKWDTIFKDSMMTAAAIDRLVHHCVILELNLPSYRLENSKQLKEQERLIPDGELTLEAN